MVSSESVVVPQDIIDSIIEAVGDDTRLLKTCAVVSSEFLLPSRKRLFSKIVLPDDCKGLLQFLVENPVMRSSVRTIHVHFNYEYPALVSLLRLPFCSLERFTMEMEVDERVFTDDGFRWNDCSSRELQDALTTILYSPTLKTVHLDGIDMPNVLTLQGIHLTKLVLRSVLSVFHVDYMRCRPPASDDVATTATQTVIDQLEWSLSEPVDDLPDPVFLPFMSHLRVFDIHVNPSDTTIGHLDILTFFIRSLRLYPSSPPALECIKISITVHVTEYMLDNDAFFDDLDSDPVWYHLNSFSAHPSGSRLQRVDLEIRFREDGNIVDANESVFEDILRELPLLRKRGILFIQSHNDPWRWSGDGSDSEDSSEE